MNDHAHADTVKGAHHKAATEKQKSALEIGSQYLRTLSIDIPNTPDVFRHLPSKPSVGLVVDVNARQLADGQPNFEVSLVIRAQGLEQPEKNGTTPRVLYEAHIAYAGLFSVAGVSSPAEVEPLLLAKAPEYLFPSARIILLNTVREAGFPVMNIQPIDFHNLWLSRKK
ncbi:protein-export chaperone SecB [Swingsia samuiensis]|uniref:Protein-export chaperone SecB n=1 Tax=Swingsia samuiensis TaxID=1293412 RepID=A0A4Y6UN53_9PROT|nr:protein-export chaperone SecB [Swingsia samuiensis]QDH17787.1 protein-export chaperone SecB [Swingsia samuiensis]